MERANCIGTDTESFFYDGGPSAENMTARRVCAACEVQAECLEWALVHEEYGMWGGMSAFERRELRKQKRIPYRSLMAAYK